MRAAIKDQTIMATGKSEGEEPKRSSSRPGDSDVHRRQRGKNLLVLTVLLALVVLFYFTAIVRMSGG